MEEVLNKMHKMQFIKITGPRATTQLTGFSGKIILTAPEPSGSKNNFKVSEEINSFLNTKFFNEILDNMDIEKNNGHYCL
jgi:hypothetical protein